ncbi:uncharacterized protein BKA78DRAFT_21151 [Phyllosticta capitalensis]|uniref:uncharacterized protein n=1 Tax=Phyllosticta capitalensis TaxID=121624 RepID=UPI00312E7564
MPLQKRRPKNVRTESTETAGDAPMQPTRRVPSNGNRFSTFFRSWNKSSDSTRRFSRSFDLFRNFKSVEALDQIESPHVGDSDSRSLLSVCRTVAVPCWRMQISGHSTKRIAHTSYRQRPRVRNLPYTFGSNVSHREKDPNTYLHTHLVIDDAPRRSSTANRNIPTHHNNAPRHSFRRTEYSLLCLSYHDM